VQNAIQQLQSTEELKALTQTRENHPLASSFLNSLPDHWGIAPFKPVLWLCHLLWSLAARTGYPWPSFKIYYPVPMWAMRSWAPSFPPQADEQYPKAFFVSQSSLFRLLTFVLFMFHRQLLFYLAAYW